MAIDTEALKALAEKAQYLIPAEWNLDADFERGDDLTVNIDSCPMVTVLGAESFPCLDGDGVLQQYDITDAVARYIVAANPATVLELLAELDRLRAETQWVPVEPGGKLPPMRLGVGDFGTSENCDVTVFGFVRPAFLDENGVWWDRESHRAYPADSVTAWRYSPKPYEQPESKENNTP